MPRRLGEWVLDLKLVRPLRDLSRYAPRAGLAMAAGTVKNLLGNVKPTPVPGRTERIRLVVREKLRLSPLLKMLPEGARVVVKVDLDESFGKPLLLTLDVVMMATIEELRAYSEAEQKTLSGLLSDLLDRAVLVAWDNPEIAPVAVRGRIVFENTGDEGAKAITVADMTTLGFEDEIARVEDLYQRFGAPLADPDWQP